MREVILGSRVIVANESCVVTRVSSDAGDILYEIISLAYSDGQRMISSNQIQNVD